MQRALLLVLVLLALAIGAVLGFVLSTDARPAAGAGAGDPAAQAEIERLTREAAGLRRTIEELERARAMPLDRAPAAADRPGSAPSERSRAEPGEVRDGRWYLERYVLSFADGGEGSEDLRLFVEACAPEIVRPICDLATDAARPLPLRVALVKILGRARFRDDRSVGETLLGVLRSNGPEELALASLVALEVSGSFAALAGLEALVFDLSSARVRTRAIQLAVRLAGDHANATILRLLARAPDDAAAIELLAFLDGADTETALLVFQRASGMSQPVRLFAAQRIGDFPDPPLRGFVEEWLRVETDELVIAALRYASRMQQATPPWHARQVIGPPDADRRHDDPKAWASAQPEMGLQWLDLRYAPPMIASAARIFEVNAPGAVAELLARDPAGSWVSLWKGTAQAQGEGPLVIEFRPPAFAVQTLRVVVDTSRVPDWNEIDAVELVGPGGGQWACDASASSYFGQRARRGGKVEGFGK